VLTLHHSAANNVSAGVDAQGQSAEAGSYRNRFTAVRANSSSCAAIPRPAMYPHSALVTGTRSSDSLSTERDHKITLQFHWQREAIRIRAATPANRLPDLIARPATAPAAYKCAPPTGWPAPTGGSHFVPRIDDEILVDYIRRRRTIPKIYFDLYNRKTWPPYSLLGGDAALTMPAPSAAIHTRGIDGQTTPLRHR